jgi:hypothetical protein
VVVGHVNKEFILEVNTEKLSAIVFMSHHHHHQLDSAAWALALLRSFSQLSISVAKFLQFFTPQSLVSSPDYIKNSL